VKTMLAAPHSRIVSATFWEIGRPLFAVSSASL
jgi:hypothetical protein